MFMRSGKTDNFSIKFLGRLTVNFSTLLTMNKELPTLIYESVGHVQHWKAAWYRACMRADV